MNDSSTAKLEQDKPAAGAEPANVCAHCGARQPPEATICNRCGYYPRLGKVVELDPWDTAGAQPAEEPSHLQIWMSLVPKWALIVLAVALAVVGQSFLLRTFVPVEGGLRTWVSLSQLGVGFAMAVTVHVLVYVRAIMDDDRFNLLDVILRPLSCWMTAFRELPEGMWRLAVMVAGLTAMAGSVLIIGAIPYESLWDWGVKERPKTNLVGAVIDQAKKVDGDTDLEEAIEAFAGGSQGQDDAKTEPAEAPREYVECVIVGYRPTANDDNDFLALILASDVKGELKVVALLSEGIPDRVRRELNRRFPRLRRQHPFVSTSLAGKWIQPRLTVRVSCTRQSPSGQLIEPRFETMLAEIRLE